MLRLAGDDSDLAAVVVGHEMAHLQLNHMDEGQKRAAAIGVLSVIAGAVAGYNVAKRGGDGAPAMDLAADMAAQLVNRKFDARSGTRSRRPRHKSPCIKPGSMSMLPRGCGS